MKLNSVSLFKLSVGIFLLSHSTILSASITTLTDNDSTFHAMIAPYIYCTEKIHANDTSVYENMGFPNLLHNLTLQSYLKTHNVQLNPIINFEENHGLCYRISNLIVYACFILMQHGIFHVHWCMLCMIHWEQNCFLNCSQAMTNYLEIMMGVIDKQFFLSTIII